MGDSDTLINRGYMPQVLVFITLFLIVYISRESRISNSSALKTQEPVVLYIHEQSGLDEVVDLLEGLDVELDREEIRWVSGLLGWRNFSIGRYELDGEYSYEELLSRLSLGLQDHASVTIPSGATVGRLSAALSRQMKADSLNFAVLFSNESVLLTQFDMSGEELFSRMLPDTYNFYWTTAPENVIERIYDEFVRRFEERYAEEIEQSSLDLDQLVVLASIIEWEAANQEEKARISGLYRNRLDRNMRLQADPTVIYAIGEHRRLLYEDYETDHPYNTYRIRGLPPGPITNPDYVSLRAALFPEEHDYLYMVASPGGGHVFSRTFDEHRSASNRWREWIREQYRIRDQRESGN